MLSVIIVAAGCRCHSVGILLYFSSHLRIVEENRTTGAEI